MKKAKKILALLLCAVLLIGASVAGTLAYLTFQTNEVTNTFTIGKVDLGDQYNSGLDEADVNEYGEKLYVSGGSLVTEAELADGEARVLAPRVKENGYKLIPGHSYTKDPQIHILKGSEPCYLFVKVENGIKDIEDGTTIAAQMATNGWQQLTVDSTDIENVFYQEDPVDARDAQTDVDVFGSFTLKNDANVAGYENAEITIVAYAIQADGFNSAAEAWSTAPTTWSVP